MHKNPKKHNSEYDLQADLERIKNAFAHAALDMKGIAGEALNHSLLNVKEKSADLKDSVGDYIQKRPFKSTGIAMLAGIVIGILLNRK